MEFYQDISLQIIEFLHNNFTATYPEISKYVGGRELVLLRLLDEMVTNGELVFQDNSFSIPNYSTSTMRQHELLCKTCNGSLLDIAAIEEKIRPIMEEIILTKPKPSFLFDQRPVTLETVLRRVGYLFWRGDMYRSDIALIGDDDLTSIAIALTRAPKKITVFDIDQRLIDFINKVASDQNLLIETHLVDINNELPKKYYNQYDVFITDPSPMKIPFTVFLNFGINLLKNSGVGYISFQSSAMEPDLEFQNIITQSKLLLTDLIPYFTEYESIVETFTQKDLELLRLYNNSKKPIAFHESYCRVMKTKHSVTIPIKYTLKEMFGRATEMVIKKPAKDPGGSISGDIDYLNSERSILIKNKDKKYYSK
ncbi:MAG: bis-aminopropyl spermidine synthase family protein [Anaerolineales bacterium]|nr:bis-aminopropyl spermidine synthase family protein [Anaerolineales bacterium]